MNIERRMALDLQKYNFHWREGFAYGFPQKRELYHLIVPRMKERQIISIIGLRRTGKTTLLKQLIDRLIADGVRREHVLFYSFDEEQPSLREVLQEYEARMGKELIAMRECVYVFLDEVQKLQGWQNQAKYFYDHVPSVKFVISGSSSLFIRQQSQESLAGRIYELRLHPLSFREFLLFSGKGELQEKKGLFAEALASEFLSYLRRQFIETIGKSDDDVAAYVKSIVEKVVYQDIPQLFPIEYEGLLLRILAIVASHPGMLSDYQGLARELGINRATLSNYFFYLEESFLLRKLYNFSKNRLTSEKKMKKIYLATPSFFAALNRNVAESEAVENLIVTQLEGMFFWRDPQKHEVDLVIERDGGILPVEVKWKEAVDRKDIKGLVRFCGVFGCSTGIVITKGLAKEESITAHGRSIAIRYVPAWQYLLEPSDDERSAGARRAGGEVQPAAQDRGDASGKTLKNSQKA